MRGSVRKRGSTYTYILDMPPDPVTGKRRQKTKGGFRTKRECQAALNEAIMAVQTGTYVEASRRTVRSFLLDEWLPDREPPKLRPTTYANYETQIRHPMGWGCQAAACCWARLWPQAVCSL
jgi:hypothetical protein